jgi:hypothetical protein
VPLNTALKEVERNNITIFLQNHDYRCHGIDCDKFNTIEEVIKLYKEEKLGIKEPRQFRLIFAGR